jgi:hypothetical protein
MVERTNKLDSLVNKHQSVGDVVVAEVDDGGANPRSARALRVVQNFPHRSKHTRALLHTLQPYKIII